MESQLNRIQSLLEHPDTKPNEALMLLTPLTGEDHTPWPVLFYIGIAYIHKRAFKTALRWLQKALCESSDKARIYHAISICHYNLRSFEEAETYSRRALENEDLYKAWVHLGSVYRAQAKLREALTCYQEAVNIEPNNVELAHKIAEIYRDQGQLDKALELFQYSIEQHPDNHISRAAIAQLLIEKKRFGEAEEHLELIIAEKPESIPAQSTFADLYRQKGDYPKALKLCRDLLEEHPGNANVRQNYALCLQEVGQLDEAERHYLQALQDEPDQYQCLSSYLMCIHYNPERSRKEIFNAHKLWDQHFAPENQPKRPIPQNIDPDKKIRIGLISGGLKMHPVGWMITPGLENLPADQFEIYCYTTNNKFDWITQRLHRRADKWQSVIGYNDEIIAGMIRDDEIDILVELSGHAADNRLRTIAMEPAPVIVKWVGGLFNTTGLQAVDYLITDQYESPAGEEAFYTEKLVRMPDDYICYLPPDYVPKIEPLPALENDFITFGCFNNPSKVNPDILGRWASIMKSVPRSRLLLKSKQYETKTLRERIIKPLESAGIAADRVTFRGESNHKDHLSHYNQVDIALDPWPYSGGLTTCEALYMGVPVVTKPGPTFAGRHSATHLTNAGFADWVTDSWDEYVETAVNLAKDQKHLTRLRQSMREQVENAPLCNGRRFGAHLSIALREMWRQWVDGYENNIENWQAHIDVETLSEQEINEYAALTKVEEATNKTEHKESDKSVEADVVKQQQITTDHETKAWNSNMNSISTDQGIKNSITPNKEDNDDRPEVFKIETKDGVTVCTPPDLELLTPYVLLEQEQWFEPELDFIRDYLQPGMRVVDAGAGFGAYALPMAKIAGDTGAVYAFEPASETASYLEKSKLVNNFDQLEVNRRGLGAETGPAMLHHAHTPELNAIDEEGDEGVSLTTLDAWWTFAGQPAVDLVKLDINGMETEALQGGQQLLEADRPLLLLSLGQGAESLRDLHQSIHSLNYELFEYIPGLSLLADHEAGEKVDPYLMNLVAVPLEKRQQLEQEGWIYKKDTPGEEAVETSWKELLGAFPWTTGLLDHWEQQLAPNQQGEYAHALNLLSTAEQIEIDSETRPTAASQKGSLMLAAARKLVKLYNEGNTTPAVALTLARVMAQLGKRNQAVEIMDDLMERMDTEDSTLLDVHLPFFLPLPDQDQAEIETTFSQWLTVRIAEAWVLLREPTGYLGGKQTLQMLEALEDNPETLTITRATIRLRKNNLNDPALDTDHNRWFWDPLKEKTADSATANSDYRVPSEIINVKVNFNNGGDTASVTIRIPEKEVFRLKNIFEDDEYALPEGLSIKDNGVIIDIGANVGAFAIYASQWNKNAVIHCFEPNPQVTPLLELNTQDLHNVTRNYIALGDSDGTIALSQHPINTGQSSTSHPIKGGSKVDVSVRHSGAAVLEKGVTHIDVLKIDTEGAEVAILRGLKDLLAATKVVMLEYHSEDERREIDRLLSGFQLYAADVQKLWGIGTVKYVNKKLLTS
ncbi:FkbM family methyltransferase [Fodinibius sediminis]|uniref:protein O-GlcNAc transferase n=1 Tax=Fodinibius sediminis TaxID=1214077 RepID=A0A521CLJ7_9BACT|nr:FkbM family methyltransferase [Fodinibius sediminis]SMO59621.1 methyltransferase, FkbM family [Fodinibius sediminis]